MLFNRSRQPFLCHVSVYSKLAGPYTSNAAIHPSFSLDQLQRISFGDNIKMTGSGRRGEWWRRLGVKEAELERKPHNIIKEFTGLTYYRSLSRPTRSFSSNSRAFSTSTSAPSVIKTNRVTALANQIPPGKEINLSQIMKDLQALQLLDLWRGATAKSGSGYKDAERELWKLYHSVDEDAKVKVTFSELVAALDPIYSLAWILITERLLTKQVTKLAELSPEDKSAIEFLKIHAVGPKFAQKFIDAGARTIASLPKKVRLSRAQTIGLNHIEDINRLIPRSEMIKLKTALDKVVASVGPAFQLEGEILGSFRRGVAFGSDIDLVIRCKKFDDASDLVRPRSIMTSLIEKMTKAKLIEPVNTLSDGPKKFSGLIKLPTHSHYRRIDIRLAPFSSYPYVLLGGSGDALLQKLLRHKAKKLGMCLNEYGMGEAYGKADLNPNGFKPNTSRVVKDEAAIFKLLGFPYLKPEERDFAIWKEIYANAGVDLSFIDKL